MPLGQPTYLAAKAKGDYSMWEKRRQAEGVQASAPQDPRDMVKAILLEPQFPVMRRDVLRLQRL